MKKKSLKLTELKEICDLYDSVQGSYPESRHEGKAVYDFIIAELTNCRFVNEKEKDIT